MWNVALVASFVFWLSTGNAVIFASMWIVALLASVIDLLLSLR